eukprot:TRINITY_DN1203_c0_g2_i1.p1 TRINITY_DN1203_c0_g2~~TRINITY_DN1203_c0_g2_i1.p1  ORF type:complete len:121 (-),score=15.22 TRINITY_DN1203_c0_g2_i1:213-575(-)
MPSKQIASGVKATPSAHDKSDSFNGKVIHKNNRVVYASRIQVGLASGVAAGLLGMEGWSGFLFFLLCSTLVGVFILVRLGFKDKPFYQSRKTLFDEGLFQGLMTFVLMWTLFYSIVHVYA